MMQGEDDDDDDAKRPRGSVFPTAESSLSDVCLNRRSRKGTKFGWMSATYFKHRCNFAPEEYDGCGTTKIRIQRETSSRHRQQQQRQRRGRNQLRTRRRQNRAASRRKERPPSFDGGFRFHPFRCGRNLGSKTYPVSQVYDVYIPTASIGQLYLEQPLVMVIIFPKMNGPSLFVCLICQCGWPFCVHSLRTLQAYTWNEKSDRGRFETFLRGWRRSGYTPRIPQIPSHFTWKGNSS